MIRLSFSTFALAVLLTAFPNAAGAQSQADIDTEARSLFEAGRTAFDAGRFESALEYFTRAHELSHRPALLFNIASAAERLRRDELALQAYERYLAEMPDAPNRTFVESRVQFLRAARPASSPAVATVAAPLPEPEASVTIASPANTEPADSGGSVAEEWWFWTIIGVAVVGAGVGIGLGVALSSPGQEAALGGNFGPGGVAMALGSF